MEKMPASCKMILLSCGKNKQSIIKALAELVLCLGDLELLNFWVRWQTRGCLFVS